MKLQSLRLLECILFRVRVRRRGRLSRGVHRALLVPFYRLVWLEGTRAHRIHLLLLIRF